MYSPSLYTRGGLNMPKEKTFEELYNKYEYLIKSTINKVYNNKKFLELHGILEEELYQSGLIGFYKACASYDKSKNTNFKTHAINHIKWNINVESKRDSLGKAYKWTYDLADRVSLDAEMGFNDDVTTTLYDIIGFEDEAYLNIEANDRVDELVDSIRRTVSPNASKIVRLKLEGRTNQQVADILGVSHQTVSAQLRKYKGAIKDLILTTT